jgi:hypothetical protein
LRKRLCEKGTIFRGDVFLQWVLKIENGEPPWSIFLWNTRSKYTGVQVYFSFENDFDKKWLHNNIFNVNSRLEKTV